MVPVDQKSIPKCHRCSADKVFEMQLMPALLQRLTVGGTSEAIDAGVVIIFTCSRNCWSSTLIEESLVVQHDPDEYSLSKFNPKLANDKG